MTKKNVLATVFIFLLVADASLLSASGSDIKVKAITQDGIIISAGSAAGVKLGFKGTVYYMTQSGGQSYKNRVAKFIITSTENSTAEAKITAMTEDLKIGYLVEFEQDLAILRAKSNAQMSSSVPSGRPSADSPPALKAVSLPKRGSLKGTLRIDVVPSDSAIYIDGQQANGSGIATFLEVGTHSVKIKREGYEDTELSVEIDFEKETAKRLELSPLPNPEGSLLITTDPPNASISIGGRSLGTSGKAIFLAAGSYTAKIFLDGYLPKDVSFIITPETETAMTYRLSPAQWAEGGYTLQNVYNKMVDWGVAATGFSEYEYKQSLKELQDSLVGSPIKIDSLRLNLTDIGFNNEEAVATTGYIYTSGTIHETFYKIFGFVGRRLHQSSYVRLTTTFQSINMSQVPLVVKVYLSGGRRALPVAGGMMNIRGIGRIMYVGIKLERNLRADAGVNVDIALTSWSIIN